MIKYVRDTTSRFAQRPHFDPRELDLTCEKLITSFLRDLYGEIKFPVSTDDLTRLIEKDASDLDLYADLSEYGPDVEGLTEFFPGEKPSVKISEQIAGNDRRENRLRTTLTHEYGHVHFHTYLWELEPPSAGLLSTDPHARGQHCKRDNIVGAPKVDWMEWQAGYVCGALLMPVTRLRDLVARYQEDNGLYGRVGLADAHGRALIDAVQTTFQVSAEAAHVRLLKLDLASEGETPQSLF